MNQLVVANISEWGSSGGRGAQRRPQRDVRNVLNPAEDMALAWGGDNKTVVLRHKPNQHFVDDFFDALGFTEVDMVCISGGKNQGVCHPLLARLREDSSETFPNEISSKLDIQAISRIDAWGWTPQLEDLVKHITGFSPLVETTFSPGSAAWVVEFADMKTGGRHFIQQAASCGSDLAVPEAISLPKSACVQDIAAALKVTFPVLLKSEFGSGGADMHIVHDEKDAFRVSRIISDTAPSMQYLAEEYLGGPPELMPISFNGTVQGNASITTTSIGRQILNGFSFAGSMIGRGVIDEIVTSQAENAGIAIGEVLARLGFRGFFNVNLGYSLKSGHMYGLEINPRRSGSLTVVEIVRKIYGEYWAQEICVAGIEKVGLQPSVRDYSELRRRLKAASLMLDGSNREGVLPYITSSIEDFGTAGLIIVAVDHYRVQEVANSLFHVLDSSDPRLESLE